MRCASVTSKENNVRATGYIYSTELPSFFFRKLQDGWFPPCLLQTLCPSCGLSFPLLPFRLSTREISYVRLIGCQPIKAQRFRRTPQKEKRDPQLYTTRAVISLPYIFVLVSLVSYARYLVVSSSIFTDPHLFIFCFVVFPWQPLSVYMECCLVTSINHGLAPVI